MFYEIYSLHVVWNKTLLLWGLWDLMYNGMRHDSFSGNVLLEQILLPVGWNLGFKLVNTVWLLHILNHLMYLLNMMNWSIVQNQHRPWVRAIEWQHDWYNASLYKPIKRLTISGSVVNFNVFNSSCAHGSNSWKTLPTNWYYSVSWCESLRWCPSCREDCLWSEPISSIHIIISGLRYDISSINSHLLSSSWQCTMCLIIFLIAE